MNLLFPRQDFPNNLGDSLVFASFPRLLKRLFPYENINILTHGTLIPLLRQLPEVDSVSNYRYSSTFTHSVYPSNHPLLFKTIKDRFYEFISHDSINFISLNFLLQLGLVDQGFKEKGWGTLSIASPPNNNKLTIAICPMTKLNGKSSPHPGCDGIGYRFNGPRGLDSWGKVVKEIKSNIDCNIVEFSPQYLGLGDSHVGIEKDLFDLYLKAKDMDLCITTDGGYNHLFNLCGTPTVLFTGTKVTKPEFMALGNSYIPDVHLDCRTNCASFYSEVFGVDDKSKTCNLECEYLDPILLSTAILRFIDENGFI